MMGYVYLAIALICGVTKGYCGKKSGDVLKNTSDLILMNVVRMVLCVFISLAVLGFGGGLKIQGINGLAVFAAALSGVATALFALSWLMSVKRGAYMLVEVFLLGGVILTIILCSVFFGEKPKLIQWLGIAVLIFAMYIMCMASANGKKASLGIKEFLLLIMCAVSNGLVDFSQKLFVRTTPDGDIAFFNFVAYIFSAVFLMAVLPVLRKKENNTTDVKSAFLILKPIMGYIVVIAVCLFLHAYFKTASAKHLSAAQLYPLSQGGSLILSTLMSAIIFKQKLGAKGVLGIILSFAALVIINML